MCPNFCIVLPISAVFRNISCVTEKAGCLEPLDIKCILENNVKAFQQQTFIFSLAVQNTGVQGFQQALPKHHHSFPSDQCSLLKSVV